MISAELAAHPISTKRGLTALCRRASRRGISYYIRYETQTYSLTAIGLRLELRIVVGRCILFIPRTSTSPNTTHEYNTCIRVRDHMVRVGGSQQTSWSAKFR